MRLDHASEPSIELRCRHPRIPNGISAHHRLVQPVHATARLRRYCHQRSTAKLRQQPLELFFQIAQLFLLALFNVPLVDCNNNRTPFTLGQVRNPQILLLKRDRRIKKHNHHLRELHRTQTIGNRQLLKLLLHPRLLAHARRVENPRRNAVPVKRQRNRIPRNPGLRPGQQAVLTKKLVNQSGFPGIRSPNDRHLQRPLRRWHSNFVRSIFIDVDVRQGSRTLDSRLRTGARLSHRAKKLQKLRHALAVLRRHAYRITQAERIRLQKTRLASTPLGLIRGQNHMRRLASQNVGKHFIIRQNAGPRVHHEQTGVRHLDSTLCQTPHPPRQAVVRRIFQTSGIDHREFQIT